MAVHTYNDSSKYSKITHCVVTGNSVEAIRVCRNTAKKIETNQALFLEISCLEPEIDLAIICALCCLIEIFEVKKNFIKIETSDELQSTKYLNDICFFEQWKSKRDWHIRPSLASSFGIVRFNAEKIDALSSLLSVFFQGHEKTRDKDILIARLVIAEALNNISDHSISALGFATIQIYPTRNEIEFAVCDFGIGIPNSLFDKSNLAAYSQLELLKMSLDKGVSSRKRPHNRGMGLNIISDYAMSEGSKFKLMSGMAALEIHGGHFNGIEYHDYNFEGTLLTLRLRLDLLHVIDDDETADFDF